MSRAGRLGVQVALAIALVAWSGGGAAWGQTATTSATPRATPTTSEVREAARATAAEDVLRLSFSDYVVAAGQTIELSFCTKSLALATIGAKRSVS